MFIIAQYNRNSPDIGTKGWNPTEGRYCADKKFRTHYHFGTFKECVKEYKSLVGAKRVAKQLAKMGNNVCIILRIPHNVTQEPIETLVRLYPAHAKN